MARLGPNEARRGSPGGLLVQTSARTWKNKPRFDGGDDTSWQRTRDLFADGRLRELTVDLSTFDDRGVPSGRSEGQLTAGAVIRDQFAIDDCAPLTEEHPGQLYLIGTQRFLLRFEETELVTRLVSLGKRALEAVPETAGFLEWDRPWLAMQPHVAPVGPTRWEG